MTAPPKRSDALDADGTAPLAAVNGVSKTFDNDVTALEGLDFSIRGGEFLSLLGASGSGKTTVLRMLAGLIAPTAGTIAWRDGARPRETGYVFQEPALMPWATVFLNAQLPLRLLGADERSSVARTHEALEKVGLVDFAAAYPRELSGGMRMRVSLARALAVRPKLLLMDEPFAALDEITRFKLNDELLALWREIGCTVVFVTHSVFESVYLSTRTLVLSPRPGRIVEEIESTPATAASDPDYRTSPEFAARARDASAALARAMKPRP